jgi:hypothetical protein
MENRKVNENSAAAKNLRRRSRVRGHRGIQ